MCLLTAPDTILDADRPSNPRVAPVSEKSPGLTNKFSSYNIIIFSSGNE
jgi:hypothetical protein